MSDLQNLRQLQPLLASISVDILNMREEMRNGFRKLGNSLLGLAYKGTVFDGEMKLGANEEPGDNFDILLSTAEKVSIIRPILPPQVCNHLIKKVEEHCRVMLNDAINCFYPADKTKISNPVKKIRGADLPNLPSWSTFLADDTNGPTEEDGKAVEDVGNHPIQDTMKDEKAVGDVKNHPIQDTMKDEKEVGDVKNRPIQADSDPQKEADNGHKLHVEKRLLRRDSDYDPAAHLFGLPNGTPCATFDMRSKVRFFE